MPFVLNIKYEWQYLRLKDAFFVSLVISGDGRTVSRGYLFKALRKNQIKSP